MHYGEIKKTDIANGIGVRVSLFVSGCTRHCKNCFNPETWSFTYGKAFTEEVQQEILDALRPAYINGLSVLGGEPFEPQNQQGLAPFLKRVKEEYPHKTIWCYTGYVLEEHLLQEGRIRGPYTDAMLQYIDVLVDGPFIEEKKDITLRFRGSANQRLLDVKQTLHSGQPIWWKET